MKRLNDILNSKKGFVLLYAVLIMSVLLALTFSITDLTVKERKLSRFGEESFSAFFAAESGMECALYWDLKDEESAFRYDATEPGGRIITCNGQTFTVGDDISGVTEIKLIFGGSSNSSIIMIDKSVENNTSLMAHGYSVIDSASEDGVERGIRVKYGDIVDESDECEAFDVILVLDSSGSIRSTADGPANLKLAAKTTIAVNELGEDKFKFAIVDFDSSAKLLTGFTTDANLLDAKIDELNASGGTNIGKGLNKAKVEFNSPRNRDDAHDIIILITDGETTNENWSLTVADKLKDDGVHIIAIGVGGHVKPAYLNKVDSNNDYIAVDDLSALSDLASSFTCAFFMRNIGNLERVEF